MILRIKWVCVFGLRIAWTTPFKPRQKYEKVDAMHALPRYLFPYLCESLGVLLRRRYLVFAFCTRLLHLIVRLSTLDRLFPVKNTLILDIYHHGAILLASFILGIWYWHMPVFYAWADAFRSFSIKAKSLSTASSVGMFFSTHTLPRYRLTLPRAAPTYP